MNEIPDLKKDFTFLKKFDSRIKAWMEVGEKKKVKNNDKVKSNFLLHPKRLCSDSECSSSVATSPRKFFSETVIKSSSLDQTDNTFSKRFTCDLSCSYTKIINRDAELCLDGKMEKVQNPSKNVIKHKPSKQTAPDSTTNISSVKKCQKNRPNTVTKIENFDKKCSTLVEKSLKLLNSIRETFEKGIEPPDGEEDLMRRLKKLQEFSSRFSRNYVYSLIRQVEELTKYEKQNPQVLNHKILYTQQFILTALQSYYNYLPNSVGKCCSDKLKSILEQIISLCQFYFVMQEKKTETGEFIKVMRCQTELLLQAIETFDLKVTEKLKKACEVKSTNKKKGMPQVDKKKSRLSMYAVSASFRRDAEWKRAVDALSRKKYNVKSRYKTANFKHRPPVEKPHIVELPSKAKLFQKKSTNSSKSTPMKTPIREDEIKTMVEMNSELLAPPNSDVVLIHENSIGSSERLARDSNREVGTEDDGKVRKALEVLKKFFGESAEDQARFLEKIMKEVDKVEEKSKEIKKLKEPTVTVTGARNAKLICIRDDNSVVGTEDEEDKEIMTNQDIKLTCSETQTDLQHDKNRIKSRSAMKISRLPKTNRKLLELLPKEYAIDIIQYKLRYAHFHKQNPLYRKSEAVQPWILMGRISDDILDYVLQSITSELEVNEILENLYNAEFQY